MGCTGSKPTPLADPMTDAVRKRIVVWECESDQGWSQYAEEVALQMERALRAGSRPVTWQFTVHSYRLDWVKMQQVNTSTGMARAVRRTEAGAQTHPCAPARVVSAASGRVAVLQGAVASEGGADGSALDHSLRPLAIWEVCRDGMARTDLVSGLFTTNTKSLSTTRCGRSRFGRSRPTAAGPRTTSRRRPRLRPRWRRSRASLAPRR